MMKSLKRTLVTAAATLPLTTAQSCSCSPTAYDFALHFDGTCETSVGLDDDSSLVEDSVCFFTKGGNPDAIEDGKIDFGGPFGRRLMQSGGDGRDVRWKRALADLDFSSQAAHAETIAQRNRKMRRTLQVDDTTPTVVTSVTFLEADPSLTIINQDSTYFNITAYDGDVLSFKSASADLDTSLPLSEQEDLVPESVMLVLFGVNSASEVVQNTVAWGYNANNCDVEPLSDGAGVGWVTLDSSVPPYPQFCGVTSSPTEAKDTSTPTASPVTSSPTDAEDTAAPSNPLVITTMAIATEATTAPPAFGKSSKSNGSKSSKEGKSSKSQDIDAKAQKMSKSKSAKTASTLESSAKSTKALGTKAKSAKTKESAVKTTGKSSKATDNAAKAGKVLGSKSFASLPAEGAGSEASSTSGKAEKAIDAKAGKMSKATKIGKSKSSKMTKGEDEEDATASGDAKAVKASYSGDTSSSGKSGKALLFKSSKVAKSSKSTKSKSTKAGSHEVYSANGHPAFSSGKATRADPINTSEGYHYIVEKPQ